MRAHPAFCPHPLIGWVCRLSARALLKPCEIVLLPPCSCLATNPRKRPSAVDVVERLRAMPDATLSPAPPARRALPAAPGPALGPSRSARGRPGAAGSGSTAARLGATPITPDQPQALPLPPPGQAPKRLSSESDASLEAPCTGAELEAAYASPVPGSAGAEARLAAARLAAAAGDPAGGMRRSCSVLLAALRQLVEQEQPLIAKQLVNRASSSPPGDLLTGAPSSVAAVRISLPPERPRASQRQLSLDDPAMQGAGARRSCPCTVASSALASACVQPCSLQASEQAFCG